MTDETAAARLARYRETWLASPLVATGENGVPDVARLEPLWRWSDFFATGCVRHPEVIAELCRSGVIERRYTGGELASRLAHELRDTADEETLERGLRQFRQREMSEIKAVFARYA